MANLSKQTNQLLEDKTFMDVESLIECLQEIVDSDDYEDGPDLDVYSLHEILLTRLEVRKTVDGKRFIRLV